MSDPACGGPRLPAELSMLAGTGGVIRHILLGSPGDIRQTLHLLHNLRYVEVSQWSPLIRPVDAQLIVTLDPEERLSLLTKRIG